MQEEKVDKTWRLLVKKVATARVMSSLADRKVPQVVHKSWMRCRGTRSGHVHHVQSSLSWLR